MTYTHHSHSQYPMIIFVVGIAANLAFIGSIKNGPPETLWILAEFLIVSAITIAFDSAVLYGIFNEFKDVRVVSE